MRPRRNKSCYVLTSSVLPLLMLRLFVQHLLVEKFELAFVNPLRHSGYSVPHQL
jgi:hypothetical protein